MEYEEFVALGDLVVSRDYWSAFRRAGLTSVDAVLKHSGWHALGKPGLPVWRGRARLVLDDADGERTIYLKRYRHPPAGAQWNRVCRGVARHGTAWIEWHWMRRLAAEGIATARPVAFGEKMRGGRELASVVVSQAVAGVSLETWALQHATRCPRTMVTGLAQFVGRFHRRGYVHRDLYLSHVFYAESSREFCLIDLQRMGRPVWRRASRRIKDLAALDFSAPGGVVTSTDRIRFLRRYLGVRRMDECAKWLARRVRAKSNSIARHDQRRRVRLAMERGN